MAVFVEANNIPQPTEATAVNGLGTLVLENLVPASQQRYENVVGGPASLQLLTSPLLLVFMRLRKHAFTYSCLKLSSPFQEWREVSFCQGFPLEPHSLPLQSFLLPFAISLSRVGHLCGGCCCVLWRLWLVPCAVLMTVRGIIVVERMDNSSYAWLTPICALCHP